MASVRLPAILCAALVATSAQQIPERRLAITHASLIDVVSGTLVQDVTVVIAGERIVSVDAGRGSPPDGADAIDGRGAYLIPGLWDMHVHVSYARASSLPVFVANGVTAVRDMGSELAEIDQWRGQIAANGIIGPTIIRAGPILNGREFNRFQLSVANEIEARTAVRTLQKAGVDLIKMHRQASREAYFAAADEARTLGLPFSGHIPVTVPPLEAADARPASIEHTETLFEGTFATEHTHQDLAAEIARWRATQAAELFAKFARNNIAVDPTLSAQEYIVRRLDSGQPDPNERYIAASALREGEKDWAELRRTAAAFVAARRPLLREMQAVTALMQRSNVMLITGTDTSFIHPPGFTLHDELRLLVDAGLTPAQALQAATVNCAKLFSTQQAGSIAAGKRADIVLLSANPLEDIRNTRRIRAVVVRGRYLDRQALDRVLEDASRFARTS